MSLPSTLIRPDPPVSATPPDFPGSLVIQKVFALRPDTGCRRDLPCFTAVLLPCVPPPLRREEDWVQYPILPQSQGLPREINGSSPPFPATGFLCRCSVSTLQCSLDAAARMVARSPVPVRPEAQAPAAESFYIRAFPYDGHPPYESDITTRRRRADAATGLSPVGVPPLQAARFPSPSTPRRSTALRSFSPSIARAASGAGRVRTST